MQRLICVGVIAASCTVGGSATAQFRDRDGRRYRDRIGDRYDGPSRNRLERRVVTYVFGKRAHVPRLTAELYKQANSICWEAHRDYQHNRGYKAAYRELYEIRKAAKHVETLANEGYYRRRNNDDHIARDLHEMDKWFHHIEGDVRRWRADSRRAHRDGDLRTKMDRFEETLHHLMDDYGVKSRIDRSARRRDSQLHDSAERRYDPPRRYRD